MESSEDEDIGLKQSAVFGLGVCAIVLKEKFASDPHFPMTEISGLVKRLRVVAQKAVWDDASTARKFISMIDTMEEIVSAQRKSTDDQLEL